MTEEELRAEIVEWGRLLFARGYVVGSAGNFSVRSGDNYLATPTNSCLGRLNPAELSLLDGNWQHLSGPPPTKEIPIHRAFYAGNQSFQAVVHLHSTFATLVSCLADTDQTDAIPPLTPYVVMRVGRVPLVPYSAPGTNGAVAEIRELVARSSAVLLANHGPVVGASSLSSAVFAAEELEETAKLVMLARGSKVRLLSSEAVADLELRYKRNMS